MYSRDRLKKMSHPWPIDYYGIQRPEQYDYCKNIICKTDFKFGVVKAPVKSGKRSMVEIMALLKNEATHVFISALHRRADLEQRKELMKYNIKVHTISTKKMADFCLEEVLLLCEKNNQIYIHLDELDYGCRYDQLLAGVYNKLREKTNIKFILYSATVDIVNERFLDVNIGKDYVTFPPFLPSSLYYGIKNYLLDGRIIQSTAFINYEDNKMVLSEQGSECIDNLLKYTYDDSCKQHISVLRLSGKNGEKYDYQAFKDNTEIIQDRARQYIETHIHNYSPKNQKYINDHIDNPISIIFSSSTDESVKWDDPNYWTDRLNDSRPYLIVICQTAGRSTEWTCHPYLCWYHTFRPETTCSSTLNQDQERVAHYVTKYNENTNIIIYGDILCAQCSAGVITYDEFLKKCERRLSQSLNTKCSRTMKVSVKDYTVYNNWEDIPESIRGKRQKSKYINDTLRLKKYMSYDKTKNGKKFRHIVEIPNWDKQYEAKGLADKYMTSVRNYPKKFIDYCCKVENGLHAKLPVKMKLVWTRSDFEKEKAVGIGKDTPIQINVFYEDDETDPENYKFMVRQLDSMKRVDVKNDSMYNNISVK